MQAGTDLQVKLRIAIQVKSSSTLLSITIINNLQMQAYIYMLKVLSHLQVNEEHNEGIIDNSCVRLKQYLQQRINIANGERKLGIDHQNLSCPRIGGL